MQTENHKSNGLATTIKPPETAIARASEHGGTISAFSSQSNFEGAQRMATALSQSSLVPESYRGRNNLPNVLIAMELASRIGVSVFAAMQNLDIIHGRPSWRAQFLIATVNGSGRFTPLRFRFQGKEGTDAWGCRAYAKDKETGEECQGPLITIGLAKSEGWFNKNGSKWKTLPELMLHYRAAAFWTRIFAPELSLGMQTAEEAIEVHGVEVRSMPGQAMPGDPAALEAELMGNEAEPEPVAEQKSEPSATRESDFYSDPEKED